VSIVGRYLKIPLLRAFVPPILNLGGGGRLCWTGWSILQLELMSPLGGVPEGGGWIYYLKY